MVRVLEWVGIAVPDEQTKTFTADQLSALSKLPPQAFISVGGGLSAQLAGWIYGFAGATAHLAMAVLAGIGAFGAILLKQRVDRTKA
jgi:hypothetical protein